MLSTTGCASSATGQLHRLRYAEPDQFEQAPGPGDVRVLVQGSFARAAPELVPRAGVGQELLVNLLRLGGILNDEQLTSRLEPALDPFDGVRDDRGPRRRELEGTARRGGRDRGMRTPRDVEVDPACRDRAVERVEGDVPDRSGTADIGAEVTAAEREIDLRQLSAGLADERRHPLAPKLVAVAVEEDVVFLRDRERGEELRIRAPEDRLRPERPELSEPSQAALGVRDDEVVLRRIGAVVDVEARVHAAELGQAHRHVAVVVDDRQLEALPQRRRDAAKVTHRDGEDDDRVHVALSFENSLEVPAPTWRDEAPERPPHELVARRIGRLVLGAP